MTGDHDSLERVEFERLLEDGRLRIANASAAHRMKAAAAQTAALRAVADCFERRGLLLQKISAQIDSIKQLLMDSV